MLFSDAGSIPAASTSLRSNHRFELRPGEPVKVNIIMIKTEKLAGSNEDCRAEV